MQNAKKTRPSRQDRKLAKEQKAREVQSTAEVKAEIAARVAPEPKKNPNEPKRTKPYKEGGPGWMRKQAGITLTQIMARINEPSALVTVMLDENEQPTGETSTTLIKPSHATKMLRRADYEKRGFLGPFAHHNERRKVRRRNARYAAVGTKGTKAPKKTWHKAKKAS